MAVLKKLNQIESNKGRNLSTQLNSSSRSKRPKTTANSRPAEAVKSK
jgi:hypothetical protein